MNDKLRLEIYQKMNTKRNSPKFHFKMNKLCQSLIKKPDKLSETLPAKPDLYNNTIRLALKNFTKYRDMKIDIKNMPKAIKTHRKNNIISTIQTSSKSLRRVSSLINEREKQDHENKFIETIGSQFKSKIHTPLPVISTKLKRYKKNLNRNTKLLIEKETKGGLTSRSVQYKENRKPNLLYKLNLNISNTNFNDFKYNLIKPKPSPKKTKKTMKPIDESELVQKKSKKKVSIKLNRENKKNIVHSVFFQSTTEKKVSFTQSDIDLKNKLKSFMNNSKIKKLVEFTEKFQTRVGIQKNVKKIHKAKRNTKFKQQNNSYVKYKQKAKRIALPDFEKECQNLVHFNKEQEEKQLEYSNLFKSKDNTNNNERESDFIMENLFRNLEMKKCNQKEEGYYNLKIAPVGSSLFKNYNSYWMDCCSF